MPQVREPKLLPNKSLKIGHWTYYIGLNGGLWHQYENKSEIKRLHRTHLPKAHEDMVIEWQDKIHDEYGFHRVIRDQPIPIPIIENKNDDNIVVTEQKPKKQSRRKKSIKRSNPKKKSDKDDEQSLKPIPKNMEEARTNINNLQRLTGSILCPGWAQLKLMSHYEEIQSSLKVYHDASMNLNMIQKCLHERIIPHTEHGPYHVEQPFYDLQLDKSRLQYGLYSLAYVSFNEGSTIHTIKTFQAVEPINNIKPDMINNILAQIYLCAVNEECNTVIIDFDSWQGQDKNLLTTAFNNILSNLKKKSKINTQFIGQKMNIQDHDGLFATFEESITKDLNKTLYVSFINPRFVIQEHSMFKNISSCFLTTCTFTNSYFNDLDIYKVL